jgi:hypothetical protein
MVGFMLKFGRLIPLLAGCIVMGCVSGPQQPKGAWPWEYGKETGNHQTGGHIAMSRNVAQFGEVPKAVKPLTPENRETPIPGASSPPEASESKPHPALLPANGKSGSDPVKDKLKREYDFTVNKIMNAPPAYLSMDAVRITHDLTACNRGNAPVSVTITFDPIASRNVSTDKALPLTAIVPPNTDQVLVNIARKMKNESNIVSYSYSWSVGDYTAPHRCPEHYRFPFGDNIRAFASVSDTVNSTPYTRNAVIFSMPAGTPVLAARKGTVIQIKTDDRIDILHEDSTIATYRHIGKIARGITVGKAVSTDDIIGIAATAENQKEAYLQLTVWRPEPAPIKSNSPGSGFDLVSFPLEFCSAKTDKCGVITHNQAVSRSTMTESKNQAKHKVNPAKRKKVSL